MFPEHRVRLGCVIRMVYIRSTQQPRASLVHSLTITRSGKGVWEWGGMGARTSPCRPQSTLFRLSIPTQSAAPACMQASTHSARLAAAAAQQHAASQDEGFAWIGAFGNQRRYRYIPSPLPAPRQTQDAAWLRHTNSCAWRGVWDRHTNAHRYVHGCVLGMYRIQIHVYIMW